MAGAGQNIQALFAKISEILAKAAEYNVNMYGSTHYTDTVRSNVSTESSYIGDPKKFARGVETKSITITKYSDNYTNYYIDVLSLLGFTPTAQPSTGAGEVAATPTSTVQVEQTFYMDDEHKGLVYIPKLRVSKTLAPIFRTLDFSVSQVNPTEARSRYAVFHITSGIRGNINAIIHPLMHWIFSNIKYEDVILFMLMGDFSYAALNKVYAAAQKPAADKTLYTKFADLAQQTTLVRYAMNYVGLQLRNGIDPTLLAKAKISADGLTSKESDEMFSLMSINNAYAAIMNTIKTDNKSKIFSSKLVASKVVHYDYGGTEGSGKMSMVAVTTRTTRISQNGTAQDDDYTQELVDAERVIIQSNPITSLVTAGGILGGGGGESTDNKTTNVTVQIPSNNWNDVENVQKSLPSSIKQKTVTKRATYEDVNGAIAQFKRLVSQEGVRSCRVNYTMGNSKANVEYTVIST